ncbi:MAG TPA: hypothetical protein VFK02_00875 [Kofleriaceae bacterium]|nr:hypothetical protein [Kofleriaceae bacterium]
MSRAPAALALAALSLVERTTGAEPCPPRAELTGDVAAVARVRDELGRLGVATGAASPGCRSVRAHVQLDEGGAIAVAIVDDSRRSEGRLVSDAALAAAWIDSWVHDELDASWEPQRDPPARAAAPIASSGAVVARRSVLDRGALAVDYEQSFTGDAASWSGGSAAGCAVLGPVCVGLRVRYAHQQPGDPVEPTAERIELAALATASVGFSLGRMAIVPELGLGAGRLAEQHSAICKPVTDPSCTDPSCEQVCLDDSGNEVVGTVTRKVASYQARTAAALRIAVPLFDGVWLDGIASITYVPFAHADPFNLDPKGLPLLPDPSLYMLPGEPTSTVQLGIGLRVGVP